MAHTPNHSMPYRKRKRLDSHCDHGTPQPNGDPFGPKPTTTELLAGINVIDVDPCEGCGRLPGFCVCHTHAFILSGLADEQTLTEYEAYQAYCRELTLAGCTPLSFRQFVDRVLYARNDEPDWDDYNEGDLTSPFGHTFVRYDATDFRQEVHARFNGEF